MTTTGQPEITLTENRFTRFEAIEWWDQEKMHRAKVLLVGAGALGNEVLKNLALLGAGRVVVVDMDRIELSNLNRSVLFRESDEGKTKAECAARAAASIYPDMRVVPLVGNVMADVGFGLFRWADVVVGALDNREARVFVNAACARVGRPWIDGGIEVLNGVVRGFAPPDTACYECTMSKTDWDLLNQRRSCSLLGRRAINSGGVPTTPTTASVIGGMQAQEVVKQLHGMNALLGNGFVFEGLAHNSYPVSYPVSPDCPWHEPPPPVESVGLDGDTPFRAFMDWAAEKIGPPDAIDLGREQVRALTCPSCETATPLFAPLEHVTEDQARCGLCGEECTPEFLHSISPDGDLLDLTPTEIGLPPRDIVWARRGAECVGMEIDAPPLFEPESE